jgi:hypothetical protein
VAINWRSIVHSSLFASLAATLAKCSNADSGRLLAGVFEKLDTPVYPAAREGWLMAANRWQRAITVLTVASFLLTSCTAMRTVPLPSGESPPSLPDVKVGETVVVTTKAMERKKFEVTAIEADAILGKDVRVAYADIATLKVRRSDKGSTIALAVIVGATVIGMLVGQELGEEFGE